MTHAPDGTSVLARVQDLELSFLTGRRRIDVLRGITVDIAPGQQMALTGPSGSGKSSLLYCLAGLLGPTSGQVHIAGVNMGAASEAERAHIRLHRIGIVYQAFHLLGSLTAAENVALPLRLAGSTRTAARREAEAILGRIGMSERATHRPAQLSGGEQQRVAVARAVANDPDLLLADEPTGSLDQESSAMVMDLLRSEAHDRALILATHQPELAASMDWVIRLESGVAVATHSALGHQLDSGAHA